MKLKRNYLLYFGKGKGSYQIPQNFPFEDFIQQTTFFILSIGLENIIQQLKATADEEEIKFCKTNLMDFATICSLETNNPKPMQQATYICNVIK